MIALYWFVSFGNILESQGELKDFNVGSSTGSLLLTKELQFFGDFIFQNGLDIKLFHGV